MTTNSQYPSSMVSHTFDVGRLTPALANIWTEYLQGQKGSWEAMVRKHHDTVEENNLLERRIAELEGVILELQRQVNENDGIIKAGGRLQPTMLPQPQPPPPPWGPHGASMALEFDRNRHVPQQPPAPAPALVSTHPPFSVIPDLQLQAQPQMDGASWLSGPKAISDHMQDGASWLSGPKAISDEKFRLEQSINIHTSQVHGVAMNANNQWIATASWDSTVKIFDLITNSILTTLCNSESGGGLYSVAFSTTMPDILGCASADHNVYLWNYRTGKLYGTLTGHTGEVNGIDFHPDQDVLASASDDCTCKIWDTSEKQCLRTLDQHTKPVYGCAFMGTENEFWVATVSFDLKLRIFDMRNKEMVLALHTHSDDITGIDYSSNRQLIATGSDDGKICLICTRQQQIIEQIDTWTTLPENEVKRLRFSPCGRMLAAACFSGKVLVYDVSESPAKQVALLTGHADCVFDVTWGVSPTGATMLISASHDHSCGYWKEVL